MGRIKSKLVKRTANMLILEENSFTDKFDDNKEILKGLIPSKKIRNQTAGFIARKVKRQKLEKK